MTKEAKLQQNPKDPYITRDTVEVETIKRVKGVRDPFSSLSDKR